MIGLGLGLGLGLVRVSTWSPWKGKNNSPRQISAMGSYNMLYGGSGECFVGETRDKLDFI